MVFGRRSCTSRSRLPKYNGSHHRRDHTVSDCTHYSRGVSLQLNDLAGGTGRKYVMYQIYSCFGTYYLSAVPTKETQNNRRKAEHRATYASGRDPIMHNQRCRQCGTTRERMIHLFCEPNAQAPMKGDNTLLHLHVETKQQKFCTCS